MDPGAGWDGSQLMPRESVPEDSSTPDLGGGGGPAVRGTNSEGPGRLCRPYR
jgi:hypothetical protein